ncbi:hypothetical protein DFA_04061 [Cavenderia fasciculata]|uniref:Uncharacterized protein n=1 Tax=Cavenderia fasciculata TaxID=261658 RepID=F4Q166_CACFS|nr:uncharacterized protein DFA_04061 [Cavenderia fasciculata]EGG18567.1 hypothetical protein DFA_04061 [Cavenderia fasciculata]|eukprot:XP_004366471.1 hypothetical protein DFA_04061 [Cavenderia fasciculata]
MASYDAVVKKFEVAISELEIKTPFDESFTRPTRIHVAKISKTLSHEVTKLALLLQELRANPEFFENIEECVDVLSSMFKGFTAYACDSLYRLGKSHFLRVYKSILDMILDYKENEERLGDEEENIVSKDRIGTAWKSCEMFEKLPLSNYHAIVERGLEIFATVNDAFEEVDDIYDAIENYKLRCQEAKDKQQNDENDDEDEDEKEKKQKIQEKKQEDEEEEDEEEEEDDDENVILDDEDDDDFVIDQEDGQDEAQMMNEKEMNNVDDLHTVIDFIIEMFYAVDMHVKNIIGGKDQDDVSYESTEIIGHMDSVIQSFSQLSSIIDDVASGIYPPQNEEFVVGQIAFLDSESRKLKQVLEKMGVQRPPTNHQEIISQLEVVKLS